MNLDTARAHAERARASLDAALLTGTDTSQARASYRAALARVADLEQPTEAPAPPVSEPDPSEAERLVEHARSELSVFVAELATVALPPVRLESSLAHAIIDARSANATDQQATETHQARLTALTERIHALETRRGEIVARRARGEPQDSDAGELELIAADVEGLEAMLERARAEAPSSPSSARVKAAQAAWNGHVEQTRARLAAVIVEALQSALIRAAAETHKLAFGERPSISREIVQSATTGAGKW